MSEVIAQIKPVRVAVIAAAMIVTTVNSHNKNSSHQKDEEGWRERKGNKTRMTKSPITAWWEAQQMHRYHAVIAWTCKWGQTEYYLYLKSEQHDRRHWVCACVRVCRCLSVRESTKFSNRRELDLHVVVRELTQACLHWDKGSGLTGILKRSELSLSRAHAHTHVRVRVIHKHRCQNACAHTLADTYTVSEKATGACQNGEPCQIKREVCAHLL